jgi:hypothetical protein
MSGISAAPTPPISLAEMQVLVSRAGLTLNPGQMADLVLAWRQVVGLLALIPRDRPFMDDQAFVFRLPPPVAAAAPRVAKKSASGKSRFGKPASGKPASGKPASGKPASGKSASGKTIRRRR